MTREPRGGDRPGRRPLEPVRARQARRADRRPAAARRRDRRRRPSPTILVVLAPGRRAEPCRRSERPSPATRRRSTDRSSGCWRAFEAVDQPLALVVGGDMPRLIAGRPRVDARGARADQVRRRRPRAGRPARPLPAALRVGLRPPPPRILRGRASAGCEPVRASSRPARSTRRRGDRSILTPSPSRDIDKPADLP